MAIYRLLPLSLGNLIVTNNNVSFICSAPASAGSFTIPASVLLWMPAVPSGNNGDLEVALSTNPQMVSIPGVDLGLVVANTSTTSVSVSYQQ